MARYSVSIPIAGYAVIEVSATSEKDAIGEAQAAVSMEHIENWDAFKVISEGNVCRAPLNRAEATLIEDEE